MAQNYGNVMIGALGGLEAGLAQRRQQRLQDEARAAAAQQQAIENAIKVRQLQIQELGAQPKPMIVGQDQVLVGPTGNEMFRGPVTPQKPILAGAGTDVLNPEGTAVLHSTPFAPKAPDYGDVEEKGGFIFTRKPGEGFVKTGPARNMQAEAAAAAAARKDAGPGSAYSEERNTRVSQSIGELKTFLKEKGRGVAGYGSMLQYLPETDARAFRGQLDTLKSNIAFNELTEMREASKTGGALGAVSDREGVLLQSALGALDQAQSPEALMGQLDKIQGSLDRWAAAKKAAKGTGAAGTTTAAPTTTKTADDYLREAGF